MRKRTLAIFFTIIMMVAVAAPLTALANMQYRYVYTSNGKSLNQRSAPISRSNNKIAGIPYGTKVAVDSYVNNHTWAYVEHNGRWGYVMTRYLVKDKPKAKSPVKPAGNTGSNANHIGEFANFTTVSYMASIRPSAPGGFVNLRWAPSKADAIHTRMTDGQAVEVIAQNSSWAQVRVNDTGAVGFVMRAFLSNAADGES